MNSSHITTSLRAFALVLVSTFSLVYTADRGAEETKGDQSQLRRQSGGWEEVYFSDAPSSSSPSASSSASAAAVGSAAPAPFLPSGAHPMAAWLEQACAGQITGRIIFMNWNEDIKQGYTTHQLADTLRSFVKIQKLRGIDIESTYRELHFNAETKAYVSDFNPATDITDNSHLVIVTSSPQTPADLRGMIYHLTHPVTQEEEQALLQTQGAAAPGSSNRLSIEQRRAFKGSVHILSLAHAAELSNDLDRFLISLKPAEVVAQEYAADFPAGKLLSAIISGENRIAFVLDLRPKMIGLTGQDAPALNDLFLRKLQDFSELKTRNGFDACYRYHAVLTPGAQNPMYGWYTLNESGARDMAQTVSGWRNTTMHPLVILPEENTDSISPTLRALFQQYSFVELTPSRRAVLAAEMDRLMPRLILAEECSKAVERELSSREAKIGPQLDSYFMKLSAAVLPFSKAAGVEGFASSKEQAQKVSRYLGSYSTVPFFGTKIWTGCGVLKTTMLALYPISPTSFYNFLKARADKIAAIESEQERTAEAERLITVFNTFMASGRSKTIAQDATTFEQEMADRVATMERIEQELLAAQQARQGAGAAAPASASASSSQAQLQ